MHVGRVGGTEAGEHLRAGRRNAAGAGAVEHAHATVTIRVRIARLDAVGIAAELGAERHIERCGGADLDLAHQVEVGGELVEAGRSGIERGGRYIAERNVGGVVDVVPVAVPAPGNRGVVLELAGGAPHAAERGGVAHRGLDQRQEAVRVDRTNRAVVERAAPEARRIAVAVAVADGGVELGVGAEMLADVQEADGITRVRVAEAVVNDVAELRVSVLRVACEILGPAIARRAIGKVAIAVLGAQRRKAVLSQGERVGATGGGVPAIGELAVDVDGRRECGVIPAALQREVVGAVAFEHDVDHAGDGVRAVLCGGTVAEDLDVVDRRGRDGVEVHQP